MNFNPCNGASAALTNRGAYQRARRVCVVRLWITAGMAVVLLIAGAYAQQDDADAEAVRKLVGELADNDWHVREKAQKSLVLVGPPAVPYLRPLARDPVFEVRFRVREILNHIRVVSPEDAAAIEKCIREYDPEGRKDAVWRLVTRLRRMKNVRFYLVDKMMGAGPEQREKVASLLACVEYRPEGRRIDKGISYATDILLSLARDELVETDLRVRTLRALAQFADADAAAALADIYNEHQPKLAEQALEALKSIMSAHAAGENKKPQGSKVMAWWTKAAKEPGYRNAVRHLKLRKEFEAKEAQEKIPFLGVVKNGNFVDRGGAHVERPWAGSGALNGGVEVGDIIVEFDGWRVDKWDDMVRGIRRSRVGQKVLLKVFRGGKELELEAVLGKRPEDE